MITELLLASQLVLVEKESNELMFSCSKAELTEVLRYHYPRPIESLSIGWGSLYTPTCGTSVRISGIDQAISAAAPADLRSMAECLIKTAAEEEKRQVEKKRIEALARKCLGDVPREPKGVPATSMPFGQADKDGCYMLGDIEYCPGGLKLEPRLK